ncbi:fibronectin type III domain-containing protein [Saccharothrix sp. HUAS TT1]|uniref:fibronectin type III domain-containing protein n=1 Tax=unclassified Saccharothrix TaxID=2593673 RepID=UPI00345C0E47
MVNTSIPRPRDVQCHHHAAWAYLTVPPKRGHGQQVQYKPPGGPDWEIPGQQGQQWLVPMHQTGETQWRARYTRGSDSGSWTTGRVWMPDGFTEDGTAPPTRPRPPHTLLNQWDGTYEVGLSWTQDDEARSWRVVATTPDGHIDVDTVVDEPSFAVGDVPFEQALTVEIRAVIGAAESDPLTAVLPAATGRPATPTDLRVTPGETTFDLDWVQPDDDTQHWQVMWIESDLARRDPRADPSGTEQVFGQPTHTITGLKPGTSYNLMVVARWRWSSYSEKGAQDTVSTHGGGPRVPRPRVGEVTATSVELWWNEDTGATGWAVRRKPGHSRHKPTGEPRWLADDLAPGTTYEFGVIAVNDDTGQESDEAVLPVTTLDDRPQPAPEPPTGLFFHCIADTTAKAEWDQHPDVDAWEVWVDDDREEGAISTVTPLVNLRRLLPDTTYTVHVVAVVGEPGTPDYRESEPASGSFTTLDTVLPPDEDPAGDLPAPDHLTVAAVSDTELVATWTEVRPQPAADTQFYVVSVDGVRWERVNAPVARFTDLVPGTHTVHVYGVIDSKVTGIARKASSPKEARA